MAKVKHNPNASQLIDESISEMPPYAKAICTKLRQIILKSDKSIIEDWKWGPNYYSNGMVCGFWGFKKHVSLVFFQGALLKDKRKILQGNPGNVHNRHIKFTDVKQIDEEVILEYLFEAIDNNAKGLKLIAAKDKTVVVPPDVKKAFTKAGVIKDFEAMPYSHRKEYIMWIEDAKKEETRVSRISKAIEKIEKKEGMHDKYKKK